LREGLYINDDSVQVNDRTSEGKRAEREEGPGGKEKNPKIRSKSSKEESEIRRHRQWNEGPGSKFSSGRNRSQENQRDKKKYET